MPRGMGAAEATEAFMAAAASMTIRASTATRLPRPPRLPWPRLRWRVAGLSVGTGLLLHSAARRRLRPAQRVLGLLSERGSLLPIRDGVPGGLDARTSHPLVVPRPAHGYER